MTEQATESVQQLAKLAIHSLYTGDNVGCNLHFHFHVALHDYFSYRTGLLLLKLISTNVQLQILFTQVSMHSMFSRLSMVIDVIIDITDTF